MLVRIDWGDGGLRPPWRSLTFPIPRFLLISTPSLATVCCGGPPRKKLKIADAVYDTLADADL